MRVLDWLKKNWQWILFPVGILLLVLRLLPRRTPTTDPLPIEKTAEAEKNKAVEKAAEKRDEEQAKAVTEHDKDVSELEDTQRRIAVKLENNPKALNDFLKDAGKKARGGSP